MSTPISTITEYVLEKLEAEPLARRATVLRALCALSGSNKEALSYLRQAEQLERLATGHQQLLLDLRKKHL